MFCNQVNNSSDLFQITWFFSTFTLIWVIPLSPVSRTRKKSWKWNLSRKRTLWWLMIVFSRTRLQASAKRARSDCRIVGLCDWSWRAIMLKNKILEKIYLIVFLVGLTTYQTPLVYICVYVCTMYIFVICICLCLCR